MNVPPLLQSLRLPNSDGISKKRQTMHHREQAAVNINLPQMRGITRTPTPNLAVRHFTTSSSFCCYATFHNKTVAGWNVSLLRAKGELCLSHIYIMTHRFAPFYEHQQKKKPAAFDGLTSGKHVSESFGSGSGVKVDLVCTPGRFQ